MSHLFGFVWAHTLLPKSHKLIVFPPKKKIINGLVSGKKNRGTSYIYQINHRKKQTGFRLRFAEGNQVIIEYNTDIW